MTVRKLKPKDLILCEKCGNVMITRKIRTNNSNKIEFQKVLQCIVCRYWVAVE
ncbi:MAG: hypothetical protein ACFE9X_02555 [Promethearchaeota archaeon]